MEWSVSLFLKLLLGNKATPEGINLEHLIDFALKKDDENLINYLEALPGMKCPLSKKDKIDQSATEIISCMESMFNHCIKEYEEKMKKNSYCTLIFKEFNCFTFLIKDNYVHIQSNVSNILECDWTIISIESSNGIDVKNINFKDKKHIVYYIRNYEDLSLLSGKETNDIMEMLMY